MAPRPATGHDRFPEMTDKQRHDETAPLRRDSIKAVPPQLQPHQPKPYLWQ